MESASSRRPLRRVGTIVGLLLVVAQARAVVRRADGNPIYTIVLEDSPTAVQSPCGAWNPITGPAHPAGPGRNFFFLSDSSVDSVGWSFTSLRSWRTGATYINATEYPVTCTATHLCWDPLGSTSFTVTPVEQPPGSVVGFVSSWTIDDDGNGVDDLGLVQTVVVEVVGGGPPTVDNTVIRETHVVRNLTTTTYPVGLRKLWDWAVGVEEFVNVDETPFVGECLPDALAPLSACDLSFEYTDPALMPEVYVINEAPEEIACPPEALDPDGVAEIPCGRAPQYLLAGTVTGPSTLIPPPTPPEMLEWGDYWRQLDECFETRVPPMGEDPAGCGRYGDPDEGDSSMAYTWGRTRTSALQVPPGGSVEMTQYLAAFTSRLCPTALEPACAASGGILPDDLGAALRVHEGAVAGDVVLEWPGFVPSGVAGEHFHVHRAGSPRGPFARIDPDPTLMSSSWTDAPPAGDPHFYEVRVADRCELVSADGFPHTMPSRCHEMTLSCGHSMTTALEATCASARASHPCSGIAASGPEREHVLDLPADATVELRLWADPRLVILVYDDGMTTCIAGAVGALDVALAAGRYRVLVDGPVGAPGEYTVQVSCR